jgi:hypothetical protein
VNGERLTGLWDDLDFAGKRYIYYQCRNAISVLRAMNIWLADSGKHNVLYSRNSKTARLVDFESIGLCSGEDALDLDAPELVAIFGQDIPSTGDTSSSYTAS